MARKPWFWLPRRMAELDIVTEATANVTPQPPMSSKRTAVYLLLHFTWAILFAIGSVAYLSAAPSNADINPWGVRVLSLMAWGLAGSLLIHRLWWGRKQWASAWFWLSWWGVLLVGILLGVSIALKVVPI